MKRVILKGFHYSNFLPWFYCIDNRNKLCISKRITFTESCKYNIEEKSCVNKLFGFCFGLGVHKNSVRFGWSYDSNTDKFIIWKYIYKNGKLDKRQIWTCCNVNEEYDFTIEVNRTANKDTYQLFFMIDNVLMESDTITSDKCFITTLGFYFGGNTKAPHKMYIEEN